MPLVQVWCMNVESSVTVFARSPRGLFKAVRSDARPPSGWLLARVALCAVALAAMAPSAGHAQPRDDSNIYLNAPGLLPKKANPGPPDVAPQPLAWPRLDPGAVLCRSEADLSRLAARRRGEAVEGNLDCQVIRARTPISIVQRKGTLTQVRTSNPSAGGAGWTDAWLPEKAPPAR